MGDDVAALRLLVDRDLGDPSAWVAWPGGWRGEIATCLVDAVHSARATYQTKSGKGVLPKVKAWRDAVTAEERDSLTKLAAAIGDTPFGGRPMGKVLRNLVASSGPSATTP